MEDCYNYNRIIEAIEENIRREDKEIYELAANAAGLSRREAAIIVKSVEGEDYSMYIKRRKTIRCAQHKLLNPDETWQDIAADFAIFEYSTFNRRFKAFLGITPEDFPEGYKRDVMEMKPGFVGKSNVVVKTETLVKKETETIKTVYRDYHPKTEAYLSRITIEEVKLLAEGINPLGALIKEEYGIGISPISTPEEVRQRLLDIVTSDSDTKALLDAYNTIIELEEVREIYGLTFEDVLYLYIKNRKDTFKLYDECERICDKRMEALYAEEEEEEAPYWEELEQYAYYYDKKETKTEDEDEYNNDSIEHMYY